MGRLERRMAVTGQIAVAQVVGEDHDNVRPVPVAPRRLSPPHARREHGQGDDQADALVHARIIAPARPDGKNGANGKMSIAFLPGSRTMICMKTITINVSEPVYRAYQEYARENDRTASEMIREALASYYDERLRPRTSLRTLPPLSLGRVLRPLKRGDDLMEEMRHGHGR